jgi:hypothetical protein
MLSRLQRRRRAAYSALASATSLALASRAAASLEVPGMPH